MLHHTRAAETTEDGGAGRDVPSNTSDYPPKITLMETRANRIKIISGVGTITGMKLDQIPKLTHFKFFNLRNANWFLFFHYPERIKQFLIPPPPWILNYHTMVLIYIFTDFEEKRILLKKILTIICGFPTLQHWVSDFG